MNSNPDVSTTPAPGSRRYQVQAWVFAFMLVLALLGMGLTMSADRRNWEFWGFLLAVYGGMSIFWAWKSARRNREPVWRMLRAQVLHWSSVLVVFAILMLFERTEIIDRQSASNVALLVLALACFLAGVHFDWTFLLLGIVLTIMVVAIGYMEQYFVWLVMLPVILAAGWIFYKIRRRQAAKRD